MVSYYSNCMHVFSNSELVGIPEIDLGSRFIDQQSVNLSVSNRPTISQFIYPLSNASSSQIIKTMQGKCFYTPISTIDLPYNRGHITMNLVVEDERSKGEDI